MEISVLGPLEVRADGRALPLGGVKPRGLLAFLLLHAGEPAIDNPFLQMVMAGNVGLAALMTGDLSGARRWFREELTLCLRLTALPYAAEALAGLAAVAVEQSDLARAARLHGAAGAHRYGQPEDALVARLERDVFTPARERLGAESWDASSATGAALEWKDAIACGFED
jgi:hypothetical protein